MQVYFKLFPIHADRVKDARLVVEDETGGAAGAEISRSGGLSTARARATTLSTSSLSIRADGRPSQFRHLY